MAKSLRTLDSTTLENWNLCNDGLRLKKGLKLLSNTQPCKEFLWNFRPHTETYSSSLNPIFLAEIPNLEVLAKRPTWLVRDGLIPLLWFFRIYPKPKALRSKLFIHENLLSAIPPAWQRQIGTYRLCSQFQAGLWPKPAKSRFLFTGLVSESFCSLAYVKEDLSRLHKDFGLEFKKAEKILCLFIRQDGFIPEDQSSFQLQFLKEVFRGMGENISVLGWEELRAVSDWSGAYFYDWNEGQILADSYMAHLCLSRGAKLLERKVPTRAKKLKRTDRYVPLSPYHGMVVNESIDAATVKARHLKDKEIEAVMMSASNIRFPWPNWLVEWSQEMRRS